MKTKLFLLATLLLMIPFTLMAGEKQGYVYFENSDIVLPMRLQDIASGLLIDGNKTLIDTINGVEQYSYNFTPSLWFWISAALLSVALVCVVWHKASKNKRKA